MHKAIKKNITEYNDGIYNFIVDLIDENNDYFGLFGLDVKYNLVELSINTLNFYPKTQYMNNC